MITYNWTYKCDYCEEKVVNTHAFTYYPEEVAVRPNVVPDSTRHGLWRRVDGLLVCPKHKISVDEYYPSPSKK